MPAYTGLCRIDGDKIIIKVDVAWDESWNGIEQIASTRLKPTSFTSNPRRNPSPISAGG